MPSQINVSWNGLLGVTPNVSISIQYICLPENRKRYTRPKKGTLIVKKSDTHFMMIHPALKEPVIVPIEDGTNTPAATSGVVIQI